jgi:predicted GNAT superfamily acetyltransferase
VNNPDVNLEVRELITLEEQSMGRAVFDEVWPVMGGGTEVTSNLMQALVHNGSYLAGAFIDGKIAGAAFAFPSIKDEPHLHSHMAATLHKYRDAGVGTALKMHQYTWAREQGYKSIRWTFDPLVRRNAKLNIVKLGVDVIGYYPNFYGKMNDMLNSGDESDRLMARWDLTDETPLVRPLITKIPEDSIRIAVPEDIVKLRGDDPAKAREWRLNVRQVFMNALKNKREVIGFSENNEYILA